jgi:tape measure domain-containing protein
MASKLAEAAVLIHANTQSLPRELSHVRSMTERALGSIRVNPLQGAFSGFASRAAQVGSLAGKALAGAFAATAGALLAAATAGVGIGGWGLKLAADAEMSQVAFETMLGSAEKAKKMLADLKEFGAKTPFEFPQLRDNAKLLLNFGISADQIMPTLQMLGDVAGGDGEKLNGLTLAFAQMSSAGRLMGQDLLQMINAGFNPLQEISRTTGESMADLKKRMEAGGITVEERRFPHALIR